MYRADDDEDLDNHEPVVPEINQVENPPNIEEFTQYMQAHEVVQKATKTKRTCRDRIEQEMAAKRQNIINVGGNFFVREEKATRIGLTQPFIKQGFLSFLRKKCNMHQITDDYGDAFVKYLEEERVRFATVKKPHVKCTTKRPPQAFF